MIPQSNLSIGQWLLVLLAILLPQLSLAADPGLIEPSVGKEITEIINAHQHPYLRQGNFANRAEDLDALYKLGNYQLVWLGKADSLERVNDAIGLLSQAPIQGLNQDNYDLEILRQKYNDVVKLEVSDYKNTAMYDTALSIAMLRFLHDIHYGRVNPHGINFNLQLRDKKSTDLPSIIKDSIQLNTVLQLPLLVEPKLQQYQKLKAALAAYRMLVEKSTPFNFVIKSKLRLGSHHPQLVELARFLIDVGDLPADKAVPNTEGYTADLVKAVKKFQRRHGITSNGIIGADTVDAINVPLVHRIIQMELAMERLRWLPELSNVGRSIIVNIPAYQLWALDELDKPDPLITNMKVVVGKALKNQTPVLMANMSFIEFMPFWNVPANILKDEILPKLIKKPGFLASQNMEIVSGYSPSAKPIAVNQESIEKLRKGIYRVRQRPGNRNSLGKVKFIFPNKDDVYLHDTPADSLFSRTRRDFSHGCVRVENPKALAEFALKGQGKWTPALIRKAMQSQVNQRVDLKQSIPVLFFYTTTFVDQDNNLDFYPDIYGHDKVLLEALKKSDDLSDQSIFVTTRVENPQQINAMP